MWSNSVGSAGPIGLASTDDTVWFTWQDTRNGNPLTHSEDVYAASVSLAGTSGSAPTSSEAPRWLLFVGGMAVGLGVAMAGVWAVSRSSRPGGQDVRASGSGGRDLQ